MKDLRFSRRETVVGLGAAAIAIHAPVEARRLSRPQVTTALGRLRGIQRGNVKVFLGIPYAEPPVGGLRFRAPKAPKAWKGVREAVAYGAPSLQDNRDHPAWVDPLSGSEDCLYLNVWVPSGGASNKPVMVWFHGGGYQSGSGGLPLYDGSALAENGDVVVVTVNHRLNLFGYLWLGDLVPTYAGDASAGQQDLVASLKWVRQNINAFGGNPDNVTIFGESGGGGKVSALLATPSAQGLFHKAIVQSGSQQRVNDRLQATEIAKIALAAAGLGKPTPQLLSALPRSVLRSMTEAVERAPGLAFQPVVDGQFMPHQTWSDSAPAEAHGVPMLIGINGDESAAFLPDMRKEPMNDDEMRARFESSIGGSKLTDDQWSKLLTAYRLEMPTASRLELLVTIASDLWMRASSQNQVERKVRQGGAPVYVYEFNWKTPCFGGNWALHGIEIPFVFGNLTYGVAWDGEDNEELRAAADPKGERFRLARQAMQAWANFARTGNPSTPQISWPAFDLQTRQTLVLDREVAVVSDLHHNRRMICQRYPAGW